MWQLQKYTENMSIHFNEESSLGLAKVAFIERWPSYRVATINRFHRIINTTDVVGLYYV